MCRNLSFKQEGICDFPNASQPKQSFDTFELENLNVYGLLYELDSPNHKVERAATNLFETK